MKLVPGNNRRGKGEWGVCMHVGVGVHIIWTGVLYPAAKAAVHRFTQSREALQREKDLLKSVKV